jgi:hypothetical protein
VIPFHGLSISEPVSSTSGMEPASGPMVTSTVANPLAPPVMSGGHRLGKEPVAQLEAEDEEPEWEDDDSE